MISVLRKLDLKLKPKSWAVALSHSPLWPPTISLCAPPTPPPSCRLRGQEGAQATAHPVGLSHPSQRDLSGRKDGECLFPLN